MAEDHQKVEQSEAEFVRQRIELSEKIEMQVKQIEGDHQLLEQKSQQNLKLMGLFNNLKKEKEQLEQRLQKSFLVEFKEKIAEIQVSSQNMNQIQERERNLLTENTQLQDELSHVKDELKKKSKVDYKM